MIFGCSDEQRKKESTDIEITETSKRNESLYMQWYMNSPIEKAPKKVLALF
jgi:hypothetical protein